MDSFEVAERASRPYRCRVLIARDAPDMDPMGLFGVDLRLCLIRGEQRRAFPGVVSQLELKPGCERSRSAELVIEPALATLGRGRDTRIFQNICPLQVARQVLEAGLAAYRRRVRVAAQPNRRPREYCVQYRESDLDFVLRLLSEEGLGLFFEEDDESTAERVVITDENSQFRRVGSVRFEPRRNTHPAEGRLRDFVIRHEAQPRRFVVSDHDWTRPSLPAAVAVPEDPAGRDEVFVHGAALPWREYDEARGRYAATELSAHATRHFERAAMDRTVATGTGDCLSLSPGTVFDLSGHPIAAVNRSYVAVGATHSGYRCDGSSGRDRTDAFPYENRIECVPAEVRFVPPEVPRPRTDAVLTAEVVGPNGEEVHTDRYGRIKVRFRFDRSESLPERSSCWIRVSHAWAGPGYGTTFIPRVGTEVLVQFQGGDVDRPVCVGCLYTGEHPPPIALPEARTQSVIRTRSSPDGEGYNEIRFEDAKGAEGLHVRAERDRSVCVRRNDEKQVGGSESSRIAGSRLLRVSGGQERTFEQGSVDTYRGEHRVLVREHTASLSVSQGDRNVRVEQGDYLVDVQGGSLTQRSTRGTLLSVGQDAFVYLSDRTISIRAPEVIRLVVGSTRVTLDSNGIRLEGPEVSISAGEQKTKARFAADVAVATSGTVRVEGKGNVTMASDTQTDLSGGGGAIELAQGEVKLN